MFEKSKTYCFGRYVVDVPLELELIGGTNKYISGSIDSGRGPQKFKELVAKSLEKRKSENYKRGFKYAGSEFEGDNNKRIIVSKADLYSTTAYGIDAYLLVPSTRPGAGTYFYTGGEGFDGKSISQTVEQYKKLMSSLRYRSSNDIPKEAGFCFENGFVAGDGKTQQIESVSLSFTLKKHPDVFVRLSSDVYFRQEKTLLDRSDERYKSFPKEVLAKINTLRSGVRDVNGNKGEESLKIFPSDDGMGKVYGFYWETLGEIGNALKPSVHLEVSTGEVGAGQSIPSTITQKEALALYEAVVKSIRFRSYN
ncbi:MULTISPECIES: T6SS immunity protein Tli4 family protein [Chromobacterium]|uniref:T6SS immunity protein Tli4 family protein n=1 Tax=Chromobacterium TaxID=535 RepID=UPI000A856E14|nr:MULTISPECIES: T6SS immunity protein Tli4 family protein [Chromobacterium]